MPGIDHRQTETDFELIAIDDDSSDESHSILKEFAIKDKRIKVFKNTGTGIIEALRLAYSKSSGNVHQLEWMQTM